MWRVSIAATNGYAVPSQMAKHSTERATVRFAACPFSSSNVTPALHAQVSQLIAACTTATSTDHIQAFCTLSGPTEILAQPEAVPLTPAT